jgi:hypothetical protein
MLKLYFGRSLSTSLENILKLVIVINFFWKAMTLENLYGPFFPYFCCKQLKFIPNLWVSQDFYPLNFDVCFIYHVPS